MGISPWPMTSTPTAPIWTIQLTLDDLTPFNVTGLSTSNFSLLFRNLATGMEVAGQGVFSNLTAAQTTTLNGSTIVLSPASVQYQLAVADVVIGRYAVYVLVTLNNGIQPFLLEEDWQVVPL